MPSLILPLYSLEILKFYLPNRPVPQVPDDVRVKGMTKRGSDLESAEADFSDTSSIYDHKRIKTTVNWGKATSTTAKLVVRTAIRFQNNTTLPLPEAYCLPEMGMKLISYKAIQKHVKALFDDDSVTLCSKNDNAFVANGYQPNGLYYFDVNLVNLYSHSQKNC